MFWYTKSTHSNEKRRRERKRFNLEITVAYLIQGECMYRGGFCGVWDAGIRKQNSV